MPLLSSDEKEKFLRTLEEDRGFRYAVMGLLGFKELLERFARLEERQSELEKWFRELAKRQQRLEERQQKLEERQQRLEERFARLEERFVKLEERFAKLEERQQRLEERFVKLEERQQKLEERFIGLEERMMKLEERMVKVGESVEELSRAVVTIGNRFGVLAESAFRNAISGILRRYFGAEAKRWTYIDEDGIVYGYRALVEVDVVVKDNVHILIEVKSRADPGDVLELVRIGKLYEKVVGLKPRLAIVAGYVSKRTYEVAARNDVEIYTYLRGC